MDTASTQPNAQLSPQQMPVGELQQLETLIGRKAAQVDELKEKLRNFREQLKNIIDNDDPLQSAEQTAQEALTAITKRKGEIRNLPEFRNLKMQAKEIQTELNELQESLNTHLVNLYQLTGAKEFKTLAGETREFKLVAKLMPKKKA